MTNAEIARKNADLIVMGLTAGTMAEYSASADKLSDEIYTAIKVELDMKDKFLEAKQKTIEEQAKKLVGLDTALYENVEALQKAWETLDDERKATIESLRAEVEAFRTWSMAAFGTTHPEMNHDPKPTYTELEAEVERLKKTKSACCASCEDEKDQGFDPGTSLCCCIHSVDHNDYKTRCDLEAQLSRLKEILKVKDEALTTLLEGHFNLYKMAFGEQSDPDADCVRREAKQALSKTWEDGV